MATEASDLSERDSYARTRRQAEVIRSLDGGDREGVEGRMTPTIRRKVERGLARLDARARHAAARGTQGHEPDVLRRLPRACPDDWGTIGNRDVLAEGGIHLRD